MVYGPTGAYLVHDVLVVYGLQYLCFNGSMQVRIHELKHEVDVLVVVRFNHVQQLNYILMRGEGLMCVCVCVHGQYAVLLTTVPYMADMYM